MTSQTGQWDDVAFQFLNAIGHPLRPIAEDTALFESYCAAVLEKVQSPAALILGVTPELFHLLRERAEVYAADRSTSMIEHVWPGTTKQVFELDWLEIARIPRQFDLVLLDGGLHLLDYPVAQSELISSVTKILGPGGRFILRLFTPPARPESVDKVIAAVRAGAVPSMSHLKVRLGTALQESAEAGVQLDQVWKTLQTHLPDLDSIGAFYGWRSQETDSFHHYREKLARYSFATCEQARALVEEFAPDFSFVDVSTSSYPMGCQFPVMCFQKEPGR